MKSLMLVITLASAVAVAETGTFTVKGMHCSGCKEMVSKKVCEGEAGKDVESCTVKITNAKKETGEIVIVTKAGAKVNEAAVTAGVKAAGDEYKVTKVQIKDMIAKDMKDGATATATLTEGAPGTEAKTETAETTSTDADGKTVVKTVTTKKIVQKMEAKNGHSAVGSTNRNNSVTTDSTTGQTTITPEKK